MVVWIRKKSQEEWWIQYILLLPFAFFLLMDIFHLPSVVKYTIDIVWVLLLTTIAINRFRIKNAGKILPIIVAFFLFSIAGIMLEYQSIFYCLWGFRNYARFFVFFLSCIAFLNRESVNDYIRFLDKVYVINFATLMFQFLALGKRQDFLGGIFGMSRGCNAFTNIFMLILTTWHILLYMNGKERILSCMMFCVTAILIAAFAELKFFFVEFAAVVVLSALLTKFSMKKVGICFFVVILLVVGFNVLTALSPEYASWFTLKKFWDSASNKTGYTNSGDMNRLTAVGISWNRFLDTWPRKLFGLGLGNCDRADGFEFLTTPFYRNYKWLHYDWFSSSFLILETGIIGLIVYVSFFVQVFFSARKEEKRALEGKEYCQLTQIIAAMCLLLIIYDGSLRTEAGYMVYFVLALPFISKNRTQKIESYKVDDLGWNNKKEVLF